MNTKEIVLKILKKYPKTRSDDKELLTIYYQTSESSHFAGDFIQNHFQFIKNFVRYRALIQRSGLYPPTKKVKAMRERYRVEKTKEFRDYNGRNIEVVSVKGSKVTKSLLPKKKKGKRNK